MIMNQRTKHVSLPAPPVAQSLSSAALHVGAEHDASMSMDTCLRLVENAADEPNAVLPNPVATQV